VETPLTLNVLLLVRPDTFNDANVPISVIAEASVPVTVRLPMITLLDRNVVVAWRTLMMEFADHAAVLLVVMVLALSRRVVPLSIKSH